MAYGPYPICVIIILGITVADLRAYVGQPTTAVYESIEIAAEIVFSEYFHT